MTYQDRIRLRSEVRAQTLRELAQFARAGILLTEGSLLEMAASSDALGRLLAQQGEIEAGYEASDPKHPEYHSTHADIHDIR